MLNEVVPAPAWGEVVPVPARGEVVPFRRGSSGSRMMHVTLFIKGVFFRIEIPESEASISGFVRSSSV